MTTYEASNPQSISIRSAEAKNFFAQVSVLTERAKRVAGRFVIKEFKSDKEAQAAVDNYTTLKNQGFPVPNTFRRFTGQDHHIIATDLTCNGKYRVFSANEFEQMEVEDQFELNNYEEIENQVKAIAVKADNLGHVFLEDVYFIQVDNAGKGQIILGDFGENGMSLSENASKRSIVRRLVEDIEDPSQDAVGPFLWHLRGAMRKP